MKKSRLIFSLAAGLIVVAIIIIVLLPTIVSSDMMKSFVIARVNQQLPGQLQMDSWSLSWFSGIEGQKVVYDNRGDGLLARIPEFKTEKGLYGLILAGGHLGAVEIREPAILYYLPDRTADRESQGLPPAAPSAESTRPAQKALVIPAFYGKINITDGSIATADTAGREKTIARNLNLVLDAPGPQNPITYRFSSESSDGSGRASGEGSLVLAANQPADIRNLQSDATLSIENWELEDMVAVIANSPGLPSARGHLNAGLSMTGSMAAHLKLVGRIAVEKLQLRGGLLGSDIPTVKNIAIDLKATGNSDKLTLDRLGFTSSLANGSARGFVGDKDQTRVSAKADVDLAEIFNQFPTSLKLRQGTKIKKGRMALRAAIETGRDVTSFDANGRIDRLEGISAGKKISWRKAVTVNARGEVGRQGLELENLSLRSSFLRADGRGDMRNMQVDLSADLKEALVELRKFIEIKPWDGSGKLKLNLNLKATPQELTRAIMKLRIDGFVLSRNRRPILARQTIRADMAGDVQVAAADTGNILINPALKIQSSVVSATVTAQEVAGTEATSLPNATDLKLDANINLQQLSSLLKNLKILPVKTLLAGKSSVKAGATLQEGRLTLDNARVDTQKLVFRQDNKSIRENRIILTTQGEIDLNTRSLLLAPVDIRGQAVKVHLPELAVADWNDAQQDMIVNGQGNVSLNKLVRGYGDFLQLPEKTNFSGNGNFDFDMDFSNLSEQFLKLRANVAPFKLVSETLSTISEKKVTLNADVTRSPDGMNMTINNLMLNSNALSMEAAGSLNRVGNNKVLDIEGTMTPDLKLISDYSKKTGQSQVTVTGKKATPFTLKLVSKGDRWEDPLKHLDFSGALHVTDIEAYGLKLTPEDVPIRVAGAAAGAHLASPANGGQLDFQPAIDMRKDPYILSFKQNIDLLKDVQVTQGLIDGLLATLNPLFKDSIVPDGLLGLNMKHFSWPLSEKARNRAAFAGTLKIEGVRLNSTPFLAGLLDLIGISERQLSLADQAIDFEAQNGRIALSPITLNAEGYQLKMHGSIGFDNTLDFIARIPVTEKLVGKDAYQFLEGATIKVPIRGTTSRPRLDEAAFQQAAGDLMEQALKKNIEKGAQNFLKNLFK